MNFNPFQSFRFSRSRFQSDASQREALNLNPPVAMAAYHSLGKPVWSARNYESLVKIGYQRNVIVYRCVELIAHSLSNIPWLLYEVSPEGEYERLQHPLLSLLKNPNSKQSSCSFLKTLFSQLLLSGNAYIQASFVPDARSVSSSQGASFALDARSVSSSQRTLSASVPTQLKVLRSDRVQVLLDEQGHQVGFGVTTHNKNKIYPFDRSTGKTEILHIKMFNPLNDWYGMSPLEAAAQAIDLHNAVGAHNLAILQNGGRPSGALIIHAGENQLPMSPHRREELRKDLRECYGGVDNAGRILVLEGNCEWKEMGFSPRDMDFNAGRNSSAREIAQAFGVPPILIGLTENATFSNYKEARLNLWEETLLPLLDLFVAELNRWLVPYFGSNLEIRYDRDAIPALAAKRDKLWETLQKTDFLTVNEKRQTLGYDPLPDRVLETCVKSNDVNRQKQEASGQGVSPLTEKKQWTAQEDALQTKAVRTNDQEVANDL